MTILSAVIFVCLWFGCGIAFLLGAVLGRRAGVKEGHLQAKGEMLDARMDEIDRELAERDQRIGRGIRKESGRFEL